MYAYMNGAMQEEIYQAFDDFQRGRLQNPQDDVWAGEQQPASAQNTSATAAVH